jgi:predicted TPR repeat methyltransferase
MSDIDTGSSPNLRRSYDLGGDSAATEALYDEWADAYENDTSQEMGYVAPAVAAGRLAELLPDRSAAVLDAGCGTGLVGVELARRGLTTIDGLDISAGMLAKARGTKVYRHLDRADLTATLPVADGSYDAVVCVGTLTEGHLGPEVLPEFLRVVRPGGLVVGTIIEAIWEARGFRRAIDTLIKDGLATLQEAEVWPCRTKQGINCRLPVLRALR